MPQQSSAADTFSPWDEEYVRTPGSYLWGTGPSSLARDLVSLVRPAGRILDLGCGEGRDSVFFAEHGFEVTGLEASRAGLEKARHLAGKRGVTVRWIECALPDLPPVGPFDLIYSCGSIHYVPSADRPHLLRRLRRMTVRGGLHAHIVFTDRLIYSEKGEVVAYFRPGELDQAFWPAEVLRREEGLIPCAQDGRRHFHSTETLVATCDSSVV